jgi:hypothetical protein
MQRDTIGGVINWARLAEFEGTCLECVRVTSAETADFLKQLARGSLTTHETSRLRISVLEKRQPEMTLVK